MANNNNKTNGNTNVSNGSTNKKKNNGYKQAMTGKGRQKPRGGAKPKNAEREESKKNSNSKRINYDNAREDKVAKQIMADAKSGKFNDINDFLKNPTLLASAAKLPIYPIIGSNVGELESIAGITSIRWVPSYGGYGAGIAAQLDVEGVSTPFSTPPIAINMASDSAYSFLVHANSRNYQYNSSDMSMLIFAGAQVFAAIENLKRAYGLLRRYMETNVYMPDPLLASMGFDPTDMRRQFSHMWFDINLLITQTRQIWVPAVFPIVTRWMDLNSEVYKDSEGDYAQIYNFVQSYYLMYDETGSSTGGFLRPATFTSVVDGVATETTMSIGSYSSSSGFTTYTWANWISMVQNMIDALINSEDRGIIYGDILNAYGAEKIFAMVEINSDYNTEIVYTPEIAMQVENLTIWRANLPNALFQIENKLLPGFWGGKPAVYSDASYYTPGNWILNFHTTSDPTPEMILLSTRFTALGTRAAYIPYLNKDTPNAEPAQAALWLPATHGSEIVQDVVVVRKTTCFGSGFIYGAAESLIQRRASTTDHNQWTGASQMQVMSFDWHPFFGTVYSKLATIAEPTADEAEAGIVMELITRYTYGDHDKYGNLQWSEADRMNTTAFMSLFDVPQL